MFNTVVVLKGKEVILRIFFCLKSFQMIANGERKFLPLSLFNWLSRDLLYSFKLNKMRLSQRCPCLNQVWRGNLILTVLSCENPSNIWELNYGPQMCGANKLTGKMDLVCCGISEFHCLVMVSSALCFHTFYSSRLNFRIWFVSRNMESLYLCSTSRGVLTARVMINMLAIR